MDATVAANDLEIDVEVKVSELLVTGINRKGIALGWRFLGGHPCYGTILDAPELWIAIPIVEGLTVKQTDKVVLGKK